MLPIPPEPLIVLVGVTCGRMWAAQREPGPHDEVKWPSRRLCEEKWCFPVNTRGVMSYFNAIYQSSQLGLTLRWDSVLFKMAHLYLLPIFLLTYV